MVDHSFASSSVSLTQIEEVESKFEEERKTFLEGTPSRYNGLDKSTGNIRDLYRKMSNKIRRVQTETTTHLNFDKSVEDINFLTKSGFASVLGNIGKLVVTYDRH